MKKIISSLVMAILALVSVNAQQISVVSPAGETTIYRTLPEAIEGAADGSVVYLPGGGFSISDDVKITKKLTIIGIGHYVKNGNVDGVTTISGNLFFNEGSSESAVMGCYITGDIIIGDEDTSMNDVLVRYCNLNSVQVKNANSSGIIVNQSYLRSNSSFGNTNAKITNNITSSIQNVDSGVISNNMVLGSIGFNRWSYSGYYYVAMSNINNSIINCNWFKTPLNTWVEFDSYSCKCYNCQGSNNYGANWGDDPIEIEGELDKIFKKWNNGAISPASNFHFNNEYLEYESKVGIYSGTGFNDNQLAPVPYIIYKDIPEQTDSEGKLKIQIRVKANQ